MTEQTTAAFDAWMDRERLRLSGLVPAGALHRSRPALMAAFAAGVAFESERRANSILEGEPDASGLLGPPLAGTERRPYHRCGE